MAWTTPITYTVGQVLTAATCNAQLRDNEGYLKGDSSWTAPTLLNSWVNNGAPTDNAAYKHIGDFTVLKGAIKTGTSGTIAFTLAAGYRPTGQTACPVIVSAGGGYVLVDTAGNVTPTQLTGSASTITYLTGVTFTNV